MVHRSYTRRSGSSACTAQTSPESCLHHGRPVSGDALVVWAKEPVKDSLEITANTARFSWDNTVDVDQYICQPSSAPTPDDALDHLASEGVLFTNAVSSYPVSSPARAMLMTGMYPLHNKVTGNCNSQTAPYGVELPQEARCWSDVLKDMNYRTGYIGKWHLDSPYKPYVDTYNNRGKVAWNEWCPPERRHGFEYWTAYGTYDYHLKPMYWDTTAPRDSFYYVNQWGPAYEADKAIEYIQTQKENKQPFALVVSMNPPHTGYELVPDKYKAIYKDIDVEALCAHRPDIPAKGTEMGNYFRNNIRNYYACITGVDEQVGRIIETLKSNGLFENDYFMAGKDKATQRRPFNDRLRRLISFPPFPDGIPEGNTRNGTDFRLIPPYSGQE